MGAMADRERLARSAFDDVWRTGGVGAVERFFAPAEAERIRRQVALVRRAFPDYAPEVQSVRITENTAVLRWVGRGTHQGVFAGLAPTGRAVEVRGVSIYVFKGDAIVERSTLWDMLTLLERLSAPE